MGRGRPLWISPTPGCTGSIVTGGPGRSAGARGDSMMSAAGGDGRGRADGSGTCVALMDMDRLHSLGIVTGAGAPQSSRPHIHARHGGGGSA
jgi:hypothetical protein